MGRSKNSSRGEPTDHILCVPRMCFSSLFTLTLYVVSTMPYTLWAYVDSMFFLCLFILEIIIYLQYFSISSPPQNLLLYFSLFYFKLKVLFKISVIVCMYLCVYIYILKYNLTNMSSQMSWMIACGRQG